MYRIELWGYCLIALALALVAPLCVYAPAFIGATPWWFPNVPGAALFYLFGPYLALALWIAVIVMAVRVHGRRALWLLLTFAALLPFTLLHFVFVIGCVFGQCV